MGFFNNKSGSSEDNKPLSKVGWKQLSDVLQLDDMVIESKEKPVVIFKHSTRCGVSRMVLKEFEHDFDLQEEIITYFLDVLAHRNVSNEITSRFGIRHETPQMLVIRNGELVFNASHSDIDAADLKRYI